MVRLESSDGGGGGMGGLSPTQERQQKSKAKDLSAAIEAFKSQPKASTPTSGGSKDPLIYLGDKYRPGTQDYYDMLRRGHSVDNLMPASQAANSFYGWSDKERNKFLSQLSLAGYNTSELKDDQLAKLWASYVGQSAGYYAQGKKLTPWDILSKDREQRESYAATPRSVTQTSTSYDISTRADAESIFLQAAQHLLGRDPTKSEISSFQKSLNKYERANPATTTTTTSYLGSEATGQSSTTEGGVKEGARELMAMQKAKTDPEYGAYQAATTYFDAMMEMIGGS